jgi:hypothetical protein
MSANDRHNSWVKFFSPSPGSLPCGYFAIALFNPLSVKMVRNGIGFLQSTLVYPTPPVLQIHIRPPTTDELTYLHTYLLTPWSRVLLEKLTISQLVKIFSACCGTRRFITAFRSARQLSLSWARSIQQSMPPFRRSILILSFRLPLGLPSGLCPTCFPAKTLYTPLISPIRSKCSAYLILLDLITRTILGEEFRS